jgi:hypothetical protein
MQITLEQYFMGRDVLYGAELTGKHRENAAITTERINKLLKELAKAGVEIEENPKTKSALTSGWRPLKVNSATPNAAERSKHITCRAGDIYDPEGEIDEWCMKNLSRLEVLGLWMEHPSATKGYCHVQIVPPPSNNRVFYP